MTRDPVLNNIISSRAAQGCATTRDPALLPLRKRRKGNSSSARDFLAFGAPWLVENPAFPLSPRAGRGEQRSARDFLELGAPKLVEDPPEPRALIAVEVRQQAPFVLERERRDLLVD